jgi:hypothetical protein
MGRVIAHLFLPRSRLLFASAENCSKKKPECKGLSATSKGETGTVLHCGNCNSVASVQHHTHTNYADTWSLTLRENCRWRVFENGSAVKNVSVQENGSKKRMKETF